MIDRALGRWCAATVFVSALFVLAGTTSAQLRVMNYNIAHIQGNTAAMQAVIAAAHADDKPGFAVPVAVFMFQEVQSGNVISLTNMINAAAPPGVTYVIATYTSSTNEDNSAGAQAMYFRTDLLSEFTASHLDLNTLGGRNTDRWRLSLDGYGALNNNNSLYVYSSHLKASPGGQDEIDRQTGVNTIRNNADLLGATAHIIYAGDMNFYHNVELGYLRFFNAGAGQAIDPLGTVSWAGSGNAVKHTQSPVLTPPGGSGLVGGGMNDRFDFQLHTAPFADGQGLAIIPGTYRALGNDGMHHNNAINSGSNLYYPGQLARSNVLAANLNAASDHIPLLVDYQMPAFMTATLPANYGRVIQGAAHNLTLTVTNTAYAVVITGADVLPYNATASGGLSGVASDTVSPMGDSSTPTFALNTSTVGTINGSVLVTTTRQGAANPSLNRNTTGTVIRHADPSWDGVSDVNRTTVQAQFDPDTGVQNVVVDVHNLGFDSLQAGLDVDSVSSLSPPFAFAGGLTTNIQSSPAPLTFSIDTTGLAEGNYNTGVTVNTSDEDLPGAANHSLTLMLEIAIGEAAPCLADINDTGTVDIDDLVLVITTWGQTGKPGSIASDVNSDGMVNIDDLVAVITAWGNCR